MAELLQAEARFFETIVNFKSYFNYGILQNTRPCEHQRDVRQGYQRRVCYPGIQLQQYGAAPGHHPGCRRDQVSGDPPGFKGSSPVCQPDSSPLYG